MAAWSFEEALKSGGRMFRNCTHKAIFFHVTSKKILAYALTVTSFANIILKVWLTNRAFSPLKLKTFIYFPFSFIFKEKRQMLVFLPKVSINVYIFVVYFITIHSLSLPLWSYHAAPLFPEEDYDVSSSFSLSYKSNWGQDMQRSQWNTHGRIWVGQSLV